MRDPEIKNIRKSSYAAMVTCVAQVFSRTSGLICSSEGAPDPAACLHAVHCPLLIHNQTAWAWSSCVSEHGERTSGLSLGFVPGVVMGKAEHRRAFAVGNPVCPQSVVCLALCFLQGKANRLKSQLVSGIGKVKQTGNKRMNFSVQVTVSFPNGLI